MKRHGKNGWNDETARDDFGTFFIPGPTEVRPEVLAAMTKPMIPHRSQEFRGAVCQVTGWSPHGFSDESPRFRHPRVRNRNDGGGDQMHGAGTNSLSRKWSVLGAVCPYRRNVWPNS